MATLTKRKPLVLLAEDDAEMRILLASALRAAGVEVEELADGYALRDWLLRLDDDNLPTALITDLRMPGWNGLAAIRWMSLTFPQVPVLLITGFGDPRTHARALELGALAVVDKPLDVVALCERVRGLIEMRQAFTDARGHSSHCDDQRGEMPLRRSS